MKQPVLLLLFLAAISCTAQEEMLYNKNCKHAPPTQKDGKWGTRYADQEDRIPFIYDKLEGLKGDGTYIAYQDGRAGLIDCDGQPIIPFEYAYLKNWLQPFGKQAGFLIATKTAQSNWGKGEDGQEVLNDWGVINEQNEVVIPLEYGYVRCIDSNLIVTRKDRDTILHFFNAQGERLYQRAGTKVMPADGEGHRDSKTIISIDQVRRPNRLMYKTGEWVLPEKFGRCFWANNSVYLIGREEGKVVGAINAEGETLIPFEYAELRHSHDDYFLFKTDHQTQKRGLYQIGKGVVIPPIQPLEKYGKCYYSYEEESGELIALLNTQGEEMLSLEGRYLGGLGRNHQRVIDKETNLTGAFNRKGELILPVVFRFISHRSDAHPFIATDSSGQFNNIYDNSGKVLLETRLQRLQFTSRPTIFISQNEEQVYGLLHLEDPAATAYTYRYLEELSDEYLKAQGQEPGALFQIITPEGEAVTEARYTQLSAPDPVHFEYFDRAPDAHGRLIAIGKTKEVTYPNWVGINDEGGEFVFLEN